MGALDRKDHRSNDQKELASITGRYLAAVTVVGAAFFH
jgi:hypothetical protein